MREAYSVIIVGGGHAGCEAALAAARLGAPTLLLSAGPLARLSCNPAVGGLAKGHLVREIDAMGGAMAKMADKACLQFRLLNQGKGAAVWSSRAQVDIDLYPEYMSQLCASTPNLTILHQEALGLWLDGKTLKGVVTNGNRRIAARTVVLATGTFLSGVIHVGLKRQKGGRWQEPPSDALGSQLRELNFNLRRLKTGTPPRLLATSLNLDSLQEQPGDAAPRMFSFGATPPALPQVSCYITRTTKETHDTVRANLNFAPMYAGVIKGVGARYCPSLEDKVVRFGDRDGHQVFLEPQGIQNKLIYPNGISTSLPLDVQEKLVRTLPGCENAIIVQPGYAIEYDMSDPLDLTPWLESQILPGLFMAGQINGTSGYEEAAAQGLVAGINAARVAMGLSPATFSRAQSFIGVLVDDLVTKGTNEPYRMFTSRSEYRLSLREDNADIRLMPYAHELGLLDSHTWQTFSARQQTLETTEKRLADTRFTPSQAFNARLKEIGQPAIRQPQNALELLSRPGLSIKQLAALEPALEDLALLAPLITEQIEIQACYAGYLSREQEQARLNISRENTLIPPDMDFTGCSGLSREVQEKLTRIRPLNLGQAGRISGITPAALNVISIYIHKRQRMSNQTTT